VSRPDAVSVVAPRIEDRLRAELDGESHRWVGVDPDLAAPFAALEAYTLGGDKRVRAAFCYWAFVGAGGDPDDPAVIDAGAALEMLHTAALVHDDIIDGSDVRHGAPTVHLTFEALHRDRGWSGSPARFGEGAAILIGDLALVHSSRLMGGAPAAAIAVFEEMRLEVNVGQYLDILGEAAGLGSTGSDAAERARRICRYKTAKYTIERPLHLGAALAAPDRLADLAGPLSDFGLPLGEAFQLKDDLLGVFGDPAVTGKPVGDDLKAGKPTLLASLAAQRDPRFSRRFGAPDMADGEVKELQGMIESTGARSEVEQAVADLVTRSEAALQVLPLRSEATAALGQLALYVAGRDR
jgi:geranylgeranyl diphosphate synthase, type I